MKIFCLRWKNKVLKLQERLYARNQYINKLLSDTHFYMEESLQYRIDSAINRALMFGETKFPTDGQPVETDKTE